MCLHEIRILNFQDAYKLNKEDAESAAKLLDEYLKYGYTADVIQKAKEENLEVKSSLVRLVKNGSSCNPRLFRIMLDLAKENQKPVVAVQEAFDRD